MKFIMGVRVRCSAKSSMHAFFSKETWFINYFIYLVRLQNASEVREGEGMHLEEVKGRKETL